MVGHSFCPISVPSPIKEGVRVLCIPTFVLGYAVRRPLSSDFIKEHYQILPGTHEREPIVEQWSANLNKNISSISLARILTLWTSTTPKWKWNLNFLFEQRLNLYSDGILILEWLYFWWRFKWRFTRSKLRGKKAYRSVSFTEQAE